MSTRNDHTNGNTYAPMGGWRAMHRNHFCGLMWAGLLLAALPLWAKLSPYDSSRERGPVRTQAPNLQVGNRVHDKGKMCMNITNYGYFGNNGPEQPDAIDNPCPPGDWAPQCEYPCGSHVQYLFQGGLWIGALIVEDGFETKRASLGLDGWLNPGVNEFYPGEGVNDGIIERSNRPGYSNCLGIPVTSPDAVSDQDFLCVMSDTLHDDNFWLNDDPVDGKHKPLGIKITQTSYAFSQAFAEDFILIDYEIENIASNSLKNLYVGLYVDSDVGPAPPNAPFGQHEDDICGFRRNTSEQIGDTTINIPIDVAWIADNDGRNKDQSTGPLTCPNVTGTRVIRAPNPRLETSFNWWISNADVTFDYGPTWRSRCEGVDDPMYWTLPLGTPMGDERKYQVMSNEEFDFDQIMVDDPADIAPQVTRDSVSHDWCTSNAGPDGDDIANGFDTRYLLSWGPLGIYDHEENGRRIYRLNHGEKFNMTIAYVAGELFHDPANPQPSDTDIDSTLFNWADFELNARWSKDVYDNRMTDTPQWDWGIDHYPNTNDPGEGDDILETGDGWYGEDVGSDGVYAELPAGTDSVRVVYWQGTPESLFVGWYSGPDVDGSERNGYLDPIDNPYIFPGGGGNEDHILPEDLFYQHPKYRAWDMGWMSGNDALDMGDGLPDFTGPPPPRIPALLHCEPNTMNAAQHFGGIVRFEPPSGDCYIGGLGYELGTEKVTLRWSKKAAEDPEYVDPFSRVLDFEGYRIHRGVSQLDTSFSLIAEYDLIDFAWFSDNDSLMTIPVLGLGDSLVVGQRREFTGGVMGTMRPFGNNTGLDAIKIPGNDSTYEFSMDAHTLAPLYYSVSAFDFGDPKAGLGPLATRPSANAVFLAPSGNSKEPVRAVPNPYRAYEDYTEARMGVSWENQNDGTRDFFSQVDRRMEFINLPDKCLIRIFTTAGDLVQIVPHNVPGDRSQQPSATSELWDLNSRNRQQVVSGIYLFSVEDLSGGNAHQIETGKFVIIR